MPEEWLWEVRPETLCSEVSCEESLAGRNIPTAKAAPQRHATSAASRCAQVSCFEWENGCGEAFSPSCVDISMVQAGDFYSYEEWKATVIIWGTSASAL